MNNTFTFVGYLKPIKASDKFNPHSKNKFDSGWEIESLSFNMICDTNRHRLEIKSGKYPDDSKNKVYTVTKSYTDEKGIKHKGESIQVPFADRFKSEILDSIASFKKFIVDLEEPLKRQKLKNILDKFTEGTATVELMNETGCKTEAEAKQAYEESLKKRHEFIHEYDFLCYIETLLQSEEYKDKLFKVTGNVEYAYSESKDMFYRSFIPTKIYLASNDAKPQSMVNLNVFFNAESIDADSFNETNKYYLNAYIRQYAKGFVDNNISVPLTLVIDGSGSEDKLKKANLFKKRFSTFEDATWREVGLVCSVIDGAERIEITENDLTDEQKEDIECGLTTFEDIKRDLGGTTYGERVQEVRIESYARGFNQGGAQDTVYTDEDFDKPQREGLEEDDVDIFNEETIEDYDEI